MLHKVSHALTNTYVLQDPTKGCSADCLAFRLSAVHR